MRAPRPERETSELVIISGSLLRRLQRMASQRGTTARAEATAAVLSRLESWESDVMPRLEARTA